MKLETFDFVELRPVIQAAVVMQASRAEEARAILLDVCGWHFGFELRVSIKAN